MDPGDPDWLVGAGGATDCGVEGDNAGSSSSGMSARRTQATVVPEGRTRSSSRSSPRASASWIAVVLSPRSSSRRSPWKTSQLANGISDFLVF